MNEWVIVGLVALGGIVLFGGGSLIASVLKGRNSSKPSKE